MKTTKIVMIVALMAFVAMSYAQVEQAPTLSIKISLNAAKQDRALVSAILQQVDPRILLQGDQVLYTAKVKCRNVTFVIFGKYKEWVKFFSMYPTIDDKEKAPKNDNDQPLFKSEN